MLSKGDSRISLKNNLNYDLAIHESPLRLTVFVSALLWLKIIATLTWIDLIYKNYL
jgi:hypothetical protein